MVNIVWTDYLEREKEPEVTAPVPWTRDVNLPDPAMFAGEWFAARVQREAREQAVEKENNDFHKWMRFFAWLLSGIVFCGGSLAVYIWLLTFIGTP